MLSCQVCSGHGGKLCPASVVANNGDHLKQHSPRVEVLLRASLWNPSGENPIWNCVRRLTVLCASWPLEAS